MRSVPAPVRDLAPDLALGALALIALALAGAALRVPLVMYLAIVTVALGFAYLARRLLSGASRSALEIATTAVIVYASGWGPALGLAFVVPLVQSVGRRGSQAVAPTLLWTTLTVALGQAAIAAGWAPTFLASSASHGIAAVGVLALVAVGRRLHRTTRAREQADRELRHSRERYRALVQRSTDVVVVLDGHGTVLEQGPSATSTLGYDTGALEGRDYRELAHPEDAPRLTEAISHLVAGRTPALTEARLVRADGTALPVEIAWSDLRDHPAVGALVAHARDVSERRRLEQALEHRAYHDGLTDLANRAKFTDRVQHAVARAGRRSQRFAVLFLDLDGFKNVNDTLGHETGDALLRVVADRLADVVRDVDTAARLGGDEFAILLEDLRGDADAVRVADRILDSIRRPVELGGTTATVDCSVGIAVSTGSETTSQLLRNADIAMYSAKSAGRGRYEVFEPSMHLATVQRLQVERELAAAIGADQLVLHYQPIVALDDERIVGVEALVRWEHPDRGLVPPDEFIPLAEETGLIVPLGRWVMTTACEQVAGWQEHHPAPEPLRLSINVSARQLLSGDLVADVARALAASGLASGSLTLEITEGAVLQDTEATLHVLRELKYLGVQLAIDDFGTGYSALSYLQRFPFDELKIDRSFIDGLTDGSQDPALVRAMVDISRSLRLRTVAEGIEHREQATRTRQLRCELGQGYLFARPASAEETTLLLSGGAAARVIDLVVHEESARDT